MLIATLCACVRPQDMLDIIDLEGKREPIAQYPLNQGGFDLIWNNGPVQQYAAPTSLPTLLGCFNPKDQNQARRTLQQLAAQHDKSSGVNPHMGSGAGSSSSSRGGTGSSGAGSSGAQLGKATGQPADGQQQAMAAA